MSKIKVIYAVTKSSWGGAQRYVYDLAKNLPPDQFDVLAVTGGEGGLMAEKLRNANIRVVTLYQLFRDIKPVKELKAFSAMLRLFVSEKPDVVHLNSSKVGGLGAIAAKLAGIKTGHKPWVVFTVHGWAFNERRPWRQKAIIVFLSWLAALFQDKIITINKADYLTARRFIPVKKLELIPNGVGPLNFLSRDDARGYITEKAGKDVNEKTYLVGTIAELTKNKGLSYFVRGLNKLTQRRSDLDVKGVIIGEGEDRALLEDQIKTFGLGEKVFLTGFLPEAYRLLKGFDVFLSTSLKEGLPYAIMEAMLAGIPIIATSVGGAQDLIDDGENGILIPPGDSGAVVEPILKLMDDLKLKEQFSVKSEKKIMERFGLNSMVEKTSAVYRARGWPR